MSNVRNVLLSAVLCIGFALVFALTACDTRETQVKVEKAQTYGLKEICLNGVVYWKGTYKLAPAYNSFGILRICE